MKLSLYISSAVKEMLDKLGVIRDRRLSNLCEVILKEEITRAIASGELKPDQEAQPELTDILRKLIDRQPLTKQEEIFLGRATDRAPHTIHEVVEKLKNGNGETVNS